MFEDFDELKSILDETKFNYRAWAEARAKSGLSQRKVGKLIGTAGANICIIEAGRGLPSVSVMLRYCVLVNLSMEELIIRPFEEGAEMTKKDKAANPGEGATMKEKTTTKSASDTKAPVVETPAPAPAMPEVKPMCDQLIRYKHPEQGWIWEACMRRALGSGSHPLRCMQHSTITPCDKHLAKAQGEAANNPRPPVAEGLTNWLKMPKKYYDIPPDVTDRVRQRDQLCVYCHKKMIWPFDTSNREDSATLEHLDEVGPGLWKEGLREDGLAFCCGACNSSRGPKSHLDWFKTSYCRDRGITAETLAEPVRDYLRRRGIKNKRPFKPLLMLMKLLRMKSLLDRTGERVSRTGW